MSVSVWASPPLSSLVMSRLKLEPDLLFLLLALWLCCGVCALFPLGGVVGSKERVQRRVVDAQVLL